jgi:translation initiation factor IF-2
MARTIEIEDMITVGTLADKLDLPVTRLIGELFKNGVMATVNERIDFDTAQIIVQELGIDVELVKKESTTESSGPARRKKTSEQGEPRPPVVAVMGHVDHGKTTLLDAIRGGSVAKGEAGGITQHISAYQITRGDKAITFLDTPGHEAFAAIREHGALLTDIALIVVAADDGLKPQTLEAIRFARKAGARIVVAINKVDKEGSDPNRVKQQLSEHKLLIEEWGGDTVAVEVSGKTGQGIDNLLDMILLVSELEDLRASYKGPASGLVIEAHLQPGKGPVAHALVEEGELRTGDYVVAGTTYAKVRTLEATEGKILKEAGPSCPVAISGFKDLPQFGDSFHVVKNEKEARKLSEQALRSQKEIGGQGDMSNSELMRIIARSRKLQEFNAIIKVDVQGSLTSVTNSLKAMDTEEVAVRIVASGVGAVTNNDVRTASSSGAVIYAFNTSTPSSVKKLAARDKVSIRTFSVIYELIDDVKDELSRLLVPEVVETELGRLLVKAIFKTTKSGLICGGEVTKGHLSLPSQARVFRSDELIAELEVGGFKRGIQDVPQVEEGELCGVSLKTASRLTLQEGDRLEFFRREVRERKL